MEKPKYINWIIKETESVIKDNIQVKCYLVDYKDDDEILDEWALHIRKNYIDDITLLEDASLNGMSVEEYLRRYIIPQKGETLGPTARSGDICEILISDLLEFILGYSVPRYKLMNRSGKNNSQQGSDVIAYRFFNDDKTANAKDELVAAEVKGALSKTGYDPLKNALIDSNKDEHRLARTINYCRKRLNELGKDSEAKDITRFLMKPENNYKIVYAAAGISSQEVVDSNIDIGVSSDKLHIKKGQENFFLHGKSLMELTHKIYERCVK